MRDRRGTREPTADRAVAVTPYRAYTNAPDGGVPEWSNGPVLKTGSPQGLGGSNPSPSAIAATTGGPAAPVDTGARAPHHGAHARADDARVAGRAAQGPGRHPRVRALGRRVPALPHALSAV